MPSPGLAARVHRFHINPLLEKHRMQGGVFEQKGGGTLTVDTRRQPQDRRREQPVQHARIHG